MLLFLFIQTMLYAIITKGTTINGGRLVIFKAFRGEGAQTFSSPTEREEVIHMLKLILEIMLWVLKIIDAFLNLLKHKDKDKKESRHSDQEVKRD